MYLPLVHNSIAAKRNFYCKKHSETAQKLHFYADDFLRASLLRTQ